MDVEILRSKIGAVFDNMYCKPPQLSDGELGGRFSVSVHFETSGMTLFGQYGFEKQEWDCVPPSKDLPSIRDKDVLCWWHHPSFEALCSNALTDKHGNSNLRNECCPPRV